MSGFRDMLKRDRDLFLDPDFFGETYRVEGRAVVLTPDTDALRARQGGGEVGVAESATLFYAKTEDLPSRRPAGQSLNVNGRECLVDDWSEAGGMATVVLREAISM